MEVIAAFYSDFLSLHAFGLLHIDLHRSLDAILVVHLHQLHIGLIVGVLARHARHDDLFHQPQIVGADRIELVDEVVGVLVGGRVAQRAERIQGLNRELSLVRVVHTLRLVDDHDRIRRPHEFDRLAARELVAFLVDHIAPLLRLRAGEVFAEGIDIHHQNLHAVARGKLPELAHALGVIHIVLRLHIVVERAEVVARYFQILQHALADCHAGNHDDELLEAILAVEFEDRAQVNIGLPRARLHLHRKMRAPVASRFIRPGPAFHAMVVGCYIEQVALLNALEVFK